MSFLDAYNKDKQSAPVLTPPSRRGFFIVICIALLIIGGGIAGSLWAIRTGQGLMTDGRVAFLALMASADALRAKQFVEARTSATHAVSAWDALDRRLKAVAWAARMPIVGQYVRGALDVGEAGVFVSRALARGVDITERLRTPLGPLTQSIDFRALPEAERRAFFAALTTTNAEIEAMLVDVRSGIDHLGRARTTLPSFVVPSRVIDTLDRVLTFEPVVTRAEDVVHLLPRFAGYPAPETTLFLFQNNDELRPTGGFIGTYGLLRTDAGVIESLRTDDVYRVDKGAPKDTRFPKSPEPIRKFLGVKKWFFRDTNWSPDFKTSAELLLSAFRREAPMAPAPSGIVAITPVVLEQFLRLTGPLIVDGISFDAENVTDTLEYEVEQGFMQRKIATEDRKKIVGALTDAVVAALLRMPAEKIPEFFAIITQLLHEKHIVLYHTDAALQADIVRRGWGGVFPPARGDNFLAVIDANLGSLKTDQVMERSIAYTADYTRPRPRARVVLTYRNRGQFTWKTTRYQTYTRVFAPLGSTLVEADGLLARPRATKPGIADVTEELGYTVFGGFIAIEPGAERSLTFVFDLPERLRPLAVPEARFTVYKQAGTHATPLTLDLIFDTTVSAATPAEERSQRGDAVYNITTDLRTDREFTIGF